MSWLDKVLHPFKKEEPQAAPSGKVPSAAEEKAAKAFFYRKWKDPAFLKQLKALQAHMAKEGINMANRADVEAWLKKNKARLESGELQAPPEEAAAQGTFEKAGPDIGRNDPCACGSGKKYKKCCGARAA